MRIADAKSAYSAQLQSLWQQRQTLARVLKEQEDGAIPAGSFDRVELSKALESIDAQYGAVQQGMEQIMAVESAVHNSETARQQGEALSEMAKQMNKMLEIYRRIASGGRVPARDERALMEYSQELYLAAKMAALLQKEKDEREYDSVLEDEEKEEGASASEVAANTEIAAASPDAVAQAAAPSLDVQA